jgi:hypothetical protein
MTLPKIPFRIAAPIGALNFGVTASSNWQMLFRVIVSICVGVGKEEGHREHGQLRLQCYKKSRRQQEVLGSSQARAFKARVA